MVSLLIALAVAGAPSAVQLCHAACATPAAHAAGHHHPDHGGGDAACHDSGSPADPAFGAAPHVCGHDGEDQPPAPTITGVKSLSAAVPVAVPAWASVCAPPALSIADAANRGASPPTSPSLQSDIPLRI